jgi:hypothetical protein
MYFLQYSKAMKENLARALLKRFIGSGASIHQINGTQYYDLIVPLSPHKAKRQAQWFEREFPGEFRLVWVSSVADGVQSRPVTLDEVNP